MLNSRDIKKLRPDVRVNCEKLLEMCAEQGLNVLITGTVRDDEYQQKCYRDGTANTPVPSFHSVKAGLAFDFCQNVKGHEYDDAGFFLNVATIAKHIGFTWGGDWKSFPDKPHLQWDAHGAYTSAMVRAGKYPPNMKKYEDEKMDISKLTDKECYEIVTKAQAYAGTLKAPTWAKSELDTAKANGITDGTNPLALATRQEVAIMCLRSKE